MTTVTVNFPHLQTIKCINIIDSGIIETHQVIDLTKFDCQNQALEALPESFDILEF